MDKDNCFDSRIQSHFKYMYCKNKWIYNILHLSYGVINDKFACKCFAFVCYGWQVDGEVQECHDVTSSNI